MSRLASGVEESRMGAELRALNAEWSRLMRAGDFGSAWRIGDRALALRSSLDCAQWPRHEQFIWRGAPVEGARVLVRCYHGLGDTLQFVRFLPRLRRRAREVVLWVQPALMPLLARVSGADRVLPLHDGAAEVEYDVDVELAELMHVLRVEQRSVGERVPYLSAASAADLTAARGRRAARARRERQRSRALRVGLVWAAGDWDSRRSIPCEQLASLGECPGIDWQILQRGPALCEWCHPFGTTPPITDILEEAAALAALDLLITVDTCSAHLAGALGVRTWTLLPHAADWRWMASRSDSPWYPTMRLIRQRRAGEWRDVLEEVRRRLRAQCPGDSPASNWMASRYPLRVPTST